MTILRSGATKKYSDNWAKAFGKPKSKSRKSTAVKRKSTAKKSSGKRK